MTSPLQRVALQKLAKQWQIYPAELEAKYPVAQTSNVIMTQDEASALFAWFKENDLMIADLRSGAPYVDTETLEAADGSLKEIDDETIYTGHVEPGRDYTNDPGSFSFTRGAGAAGDQPDVEFIPKPNGPIQRYSLELKGDVFETLQKEYSLESWFSEKTPNRDSGRAA